MCATLVALVLSAAIDGAVIDGAPNREPPPPRPYAVSSDPVAESVGNGQAPVAHVAPSYAVHEQSHGYPTDHVGMHGAEYRTVPHVARKFGYRYYCPLIPVYGPTCYNYRWQFDYPWHE
jgi:hypothetical protein